MFKAIKAFFKSVFGSTTRTTNNFAITEEAIRAQNPANVEGSLEFNQANKQAVEENTLMFNWDGKANGSSLPEPAQEKPKQKKRKPYKKYKQGGSEKSVDQLGLPKMKPNDTTKPKKRRGRRPNNAPKAEN